MKWIWVHIAQPHKLSNTERSETFSEWKSLTCAHLRTLFTILPPGRAHRAAAHLLGDLGGQRMLAAPIVSCHQEALRLLRLWQRFHRVSLDTKKSHFGRKTSRPSVDSQQGGWRLTEASHSPTHRFLSRMKPDLQEHLKLPSVLRQSPFWQTPCMEHSLMSSR